MFRKGDRVIAVDCPGYNGELGTVTLVFGDRKESLIRVRWDSPHAYDNEYWAWRFKLVDDTPFNQKVRAYIRKELPDAV